MKARMVAAALALALGWVSSGNAATVRADRPRLLISSGAGKGVTLELYKRRCTSDPLYSARCQGALNEPGGVWAGIAHAAGYLVQGDASRCAAAHSAALAKASDVPGVKDQHSFISDNGHTMLVLAVVRDWCDGALAAGELASLEQRIVDYADYYLAATGLDVYHDDMQNVWSAVALAGLSLAGGAQDAKARSYLAAADKQWKEVIFPAMAYEGDWWHEGFVYVQPVLGSLAWYALAWTTATDEDLFSWAEANASDLFNGYIAFHAYAMRPHGQYVYFGDTVTSKQSVELFSRYLIDIFTTGTGSPVGQAVSLEIKQRSRPGYDYAGVNGWIPPLVYDAAKDASATPLASLPTARWLSKGAQDVAVLRSSWDDEATHVWMNCGDYFGAHQRYESGAFQIFRSAPLTGSTGCYDAFDSDHWQNYYSQHSVHANTLAIEQPGEFFPTLQSLSDRSGNVNDGGQRVLRRNHQGTGFPNPDLASYLAHKTSEPFTETGNLSTFSTSACYDYVACDVTAAYTSPGYETNGNRAKVSEVSRQLVFVKPDLVVIFDRVQATDASYDKRFLLHALAAPTVDGQSFSIENGPGRLVGQTLLPAEAQIDVVTNFAVAGTPHPPSSTDNCDEAGGTRLEISPRTESERDYFLHVLRTGESGSTSAPAATASEDESIVTVTIDDAGRQIRLRFAKTGELGGHITTSGSGVACDEALGSNPEPGPGGAAGSGGGGAGGLPSGGAGGEPAASGDDGGCGCRLPATPGAAHGWLAQLAALALVRRSRRSRSGPLTRRARARTSRG
jgi:hypothetical protein